MDDAEELLAIYAPYVEKRATLLLSAEVRLKNSKDGSPMFVEPFPISESNRSR